MIEDKELEAASKILAEDAGSGSSAGLYCHEDDCRETLTLSRTTAEPPSHEDDYRYLMPGLDAAAVIVGWRVHRSVWWCPAHVVAKHLACAGCHRACPDCSCADGPLAAAVDGLSAESFEEVSR